MAPQQADAQQPSCPLTTGIVNANGISLAFEIRGDEAAPPLVLIMGLGMQLVDWPETFCDYLINQGYRLILLDNRDSGLSQKFTAAGEPNILWNSLKYRLRLPIKSAYSLTDMAADVIGLLDALSIERAHVAGVSMGGMIAQNMAACYPERLASLTSIMSSSGSRKLPGPRRDALRAVLSKPAGPDPENLFRHAIKVISALKGPAHVIDEDALRVTLAKRAARSQDTAGMMRQMMAVVAAGDRSALLRKIHVPTLILHGAADPLIPLAAGQDCARLIAGSKLCVIEGMGHDLFAWQRVADEMIAHLQANG